MTELRTARLLLRQWRDEDAAPLAAINADPLVMEHFPAPLTRAESDAALARIRRHHSEHGYGLWALDVGGVLAGWTGLAWSDWSGARELEVGWRLSPAFWGQGLATEAGAAALAHGLTVVPRVVSFTALVNTRSERVMKRLGMVREREFDHPREDLPERLRRHVLYVAT